MPAVTMPPPCADIRSPFIYPIVVDDDDTELITAKSVVTLSVVLTRTSLQDTYGLLGAPRREVTPPDHELQVCVP